MSRETATIFSKCSATEGCAGHFQILQSWEAGGLNDRGGWVVQCGECNGYNHVRIGRDVNDSSMVSGGTKVDDYDDELNNKAAVLAKYGLA